ncbi:hypothetical protein C9994_01775 [Marivirga lumbricoides]|uniref:Uncharacterized protein n=1 Tax=Marivirga lumbricoides TaxID=1046115 RepID=A0A2T4DV02_9BACT|nr:hypothetical protein C9994_01775 [Marivirga lumbricoides]
MIPEFKSLSETEIGLFEKTPAMITILIAGADEHISNRELQEAIALTKMKQKRARIELISYYNWVAPNFESILDDLLESYPSDPEVRSKVIIEELGKLNDIIPKLDKRWAGQFVESMRDIAKKVAESSGGVFGYLSIGYEESKLIDLKMIKMPV